MKFFFFLIYITIKIYKNQLCEQKNTCYNCLKSDNSCLWSNNICSSKNSALLNKNTNDNNITKNSFFSKPFINSQYKCIKNTGDIETFKEFNNGAIALSFPPNYLKFFNDSEKVNYHIVLSI